MFTAVQLLLLTVGCNGDEPTDPPPGSTDVGTPPGSDTVPSTTGSPTPTGEPALQFDGPAPTNVLMISVDTLRRDHIGRYADGESLTPFIDSLLDASLALDDWAGCSNWTVAGTACVMSGAGNLDRAEARGMVPILVGLPLAAIPKDAHPLGPTPMLPSWLGEQGYNSRLVTTNGFFSDAYGNAQGFDTIQYMGPVGSNGLWARAAESLDLDPLPEPFYLHLHLFDPHRPYLPPEEFLDTLDDLPPSPIDLSTTEGQLAAESQLNQDPPVLSDTDAQIVIDHMRARYAGEVRNLDTALVSIWADLQARGLLDDTLVVFWTDHGEALWNHGNVTAHAKLLHLNESAGAAFFWADNIVPVAWDGPTTQADVVPTLLTALDLPLPPEITGEAVGTSAVDRPRFALSDGQKGVVQSVRQGTQLLQFRWAGRLEHFDLATDPGTQDDLWDPLAPSAEALALWELLRPKIEAAEPYIADDPRNPVLVWPEGVP